MIPRILQSKSIMVIFVFFILAFCNFSGYGQSYRKQKNFIKGFEASFGTKSLTLNSNIPTLHDLSVLEEGGSLGFVAGSDKVKARIRVAGFYYSAASVKQTVNLFETGAMFNIYPLEFTRFITSDLKPYILTGVSYNDLKFFGHYLSKDPSNKNYSLSDPPHIGNVKFSSAVLGAGFEWHLPYVNDFFHLFTEVQYASPITHSASVDFRETKVKGGVLSFNVGISFGTAR